MLLQEIKHEKAADGDKTGKRVMSNDMMMK